MVYLRTVLLAISLLVLESCEQKDSERQITFRAVNKAQETIDYLTFSDDVGQRRTKSFIIPNGDSIRTSFNLESKGEGGYRMRYKFSNSKDTLTGRFGYYTNGSPLEKEFILRIYADTVLISRVPRDSY